MKRVLVLLCIAVLMITLLPVSAVRAQNVNATFVFPDSLRHVEDGAFEGTAVKTAIFIEGLLYLGDSAFAGADQLAEIHIPPSTVKIGDSAIPLNHEIVIYGKAGSTAQNWAEIHGISFAEDTVRSFTVPEGNNSRPLDAMTVWLSCLLIPSKAIWLIAGAENKNRSRRPQDRPELNPIDYRFP